MSTLCRFLIACVLCSLSLSSGCKGQQPEIDRLKQENARLIGERDEARRELEQLRAGQVSTTSPAAPGSPAMAPGGAATFTDIDASAARDEILDLAQLGVFETAGGAFEPARPILRTEFVRWLVRANNAIRKDKDIRLAEGDAATFSDVPSSQPDFKYIEGMANAGIVIGYEDGTFKPDKALTREELIAIKCGLDMGGVPDTDKNHEAMHRLWKWGDANKVNKRFVNALYSEYFNSAKNIDRTFGAIKLLKPQQAVTRGEAAMCMWRIGDGHESKTAAEALKPASPE